MQKKVVGCRLCALILGLLLVGTTGCPASSRKASERHEQAVQVQSFSEAAPIRAISVIPPYAFVASERGLGRWNLRTGQVLYLSAEHGLPGDHVAALSYDAIREWLWIATDRGVTRYEVKFGAFSELPPPPMVLGLLPITQATVEPAGDGGLWIGNERGLFYTNTEGQWTDTPITESITALLRDRDGWVWIGTKTGLIGLRPDGETYRYGSELGCALASVRFITEAPGDVPMIVGEDEDGEQRIVTIEGGRCASYHADPDTPWLHAFARDDELILLTSERLYVMGMAGERPPELSRHGMRLLPVRVGSVTPAASPYMLRALDDPRLPVGARLVAATEEEILLGTDGLGTARIAREPAQEPGQASGNQWLRRGDLVEDASALTVACAKPSDCYVGTGRAGWHYDGDGFSAIEREDGTVLAFARSATGELYAVVREADEQRLSIERIDAGSWVKVAGVAIETPGNFPSVSFVRFSPDSKLWLGLRYRGDDGNWTPYGAVMVDVALGLVTHHGARLRRQHRHARTQRIPMKLADIAFFEDDERWLASSGGAVQIQGRKSKVFGERDGLQSEQLGGVAVAPGGVVFVAGRSGVASYDGASWTYPEPLRMPVNDIEIGKDGRLWMATRRGLGVFDGTRVRWFDTRRGLLENEITEVVADSVGRIWVRGPTGISVLSP